MIFYDYKCKKCNEYSQHYHKMNDPIPDCPHCEGGELKKVFLSAPPDISSSVRVQGAIDGMRQRTIDKYLK